VTDTHTHTHTTTVYTALAGHRAVITNKEKELTIRRFINKRKMVNGQPLTVQFIVLVLIIT